MGVEMSIQYLFSNMKIDMLIPLQFREMFCHLLKTGEYLCLKIRAKLNPDS